MGLERRRAELALEVLVERQKTASLAIAFLSLARRSVNAIPQGRARSRRGRTQAMPPDTPRHAGVLKGIP